MKHPLNKILLFLSVILFALGSCKKDKDSKTEESNTNAGLIVGKWRFIKQELQIRDASNNILETKYEEEYDAGEYIEFKKDGGFNRPDENGTYELKNNADLTTIEEGGDKTNFTILEITSSKLTLAENIDSGSSDLLEGQKQLLVRYLEK